MRATCAPVTGWLRARAAAAAALGFAGRSARRAGSCVDLPLINKRQQRAETAHAHPGPRTHTLKPTHTLTRTANALGARYTPGERLVQGHLPPSYAVVAVVIVVVFVFVFFAVVRGPWPGNTSGGAIPFNNIINVRVRSFACVWLRACVYVMRT